MIRIRAAANDCFHYWLIIKFINWRKSVRHNLSEHTVMSSDCFFSPTNSPKPKDIHLTVIYNWVNLCIWEAGNQRIFSHFDITNYVGSQNRLTNLFTLIIYTWITIIRHFWFRIRNKQHCPAKKLDHGLQNKSLSIDI